MGFGVLVKRARNELEQAVGLGVGDELLRLAGVVLQGLAWVFTERQDHTQMASTMEVTSDAAFSIYMKRF